MMIQICELLANEREPFGGGVRLLQGAAFELSRVARAPRALEEEQEEEEEAARTLHSLALRSRLV